MLIIRKGVKHEATDVPSRCAWRPVLSARAAGAVIQGASRRVALPLLLNLLWALVCLFIVPQWAEVPVLRLVRVDVGLVIVVSGGIALVWGILRTLFAFVVLRTSGASKAVEALARYDPS